MKNTERKEKFSSFINDTYEDSLQYCLAETGDFVNAEDLLVKVYHTVYKTMKKTDGSEAAMKLLLQDAFDLVFAAYHKKHRKELVMPPIGIEAAACEVQADIELQLSCDEKQELVMGQEILEFVSDQPIPIRRIFAMNVYLGKPMEEIADAVGISPDEARIRLNMLLCEINENFFEELEQGGTADEA